MAGEKGTRERVLVTREQYGRCMRPSRLLQRISEQLNVQDVAGEAKPYQIRQLLDLVRQYDLEVN